MARDALSASLQFAAAVRPAAQAMQDNNLVPKSTAGGNGRHIANGQIKVRKIVRDVWLHDDRSMRVKGRLRARFDLDGATNVRIAFRGHGGIPEKQALTVGVVWIGFYTATIRLYLCGLECLPQQQIQPLQHRALDVLLTGCFDGIQAGVALLPAQSFQLLEGRGLADVLPEHGDVDVFGEAFNQAKAFGERCTTLEEKARPTDLQLIEERVESPANPEVFLDVLLIGAEAVSSTDKEIAALVIACG